MEAFYDKILELAAEYLPRLGGALLTLVIGLLLIKWLGSILNKALTKIKIDPTLKPFFISLILTALKVLLLVNVAEQVLGQLTSLVAIIGASGLAIGLAFQGALSNFAGGVLLLSLRPFKVGDYISAAGNEGVVEAIHVFNTVLVTVDNRVVTIPNGSLSNSNITNFTAKSTRRLDLNFAVSYDANIDEVRKVLQTVIDDCNKVLKDPLPLITVVSHGDHAVIFLVRIWMNTPDYWDVNFFFQETVKKRFDEANISIPYPQLDLHMKAIAEKITETNTK